MLHCCKQPIEQFECIEIAPKIQTDRGTSNNTTA